MVGIALSAGAPAEARVFKALTFNVRGLPWPLSPLKPSRMAALCEIVASPAASWDVVMLQELYMDHDQRALIECGPQGGYRYSYRRGHGVYMIGPMKSGLLLLSRHPLLWMDSLKFAKQTWQAERGALLAQLFVRGEPEPLWVANIHLSPDYKGSKAKHTDDRRSQLVELTGWLSSIVPSGAPLIVGGDYNFGPNFKGYDSLWEEIPAFLPGFAQADYPLETTCTFCPPNDAVPARENAGKLDHLFASPALTPVNGRVMFRERVTRGRKKFFLSDHFGWETEFETATP